MKSISVDINDIDQQKKPCFFLILNKFSIVLQYLIRVHGRGCNFTLNQQGCMCEYKMDTCLLMVMSE